MAETLKVALVCGNPKANSRTLGVAQEVGRAIATHLGRTTTVTTIDLAPVGPQLFDWSSTSVKDLVVALSGVDVAIVASPTYKATYTGLLKSFLDWFGQTGLAGVVAVPVMVGGSPVHALAPEVFLRPLLVEIGASVATRGLFVLESQLEELDPVIAGWLDGAGPILSRLFD